MYLKKELDNMFGCISNKWDDQIVFTPRDVSIMLNVPLSTIHYLCKNGKIETFKIGGRYKISRIALYNFIQNCIETSIIL